MGAWIEIGSEISAFSINASSHPTMGAWIEIIEIKVRLQPKEGRTPRWVRGLKFYILCFEELS